jgi:NAD(P)-dependent dehydrogenase (short-subunit alcohol dehydrogenase family)
MTTMPKTVLITGASTGIGRAAAVLFHQNGWNVAATMRSPEKSDLVQRDRLICPALDVTNADSIEAAIATTLERFQRIDVVVNNAGYALVGPFEACTPEQIEQQFATNVFGVMNVTRAILPHFRQQRAGIVINVASIGGHLALPLYSPYHATKWAVEGFSDSLAYELEMFNIRVKIVEPGPIKTDFYTRSMAIAHRPGLDVYDALVAAALPNLNQSEKTGSPPEVTAQVIYQAATDGRDRLRYPAGGNASFLLLLRKLLPDSLFRRVIRQAIIGRGTP